MPVLMPYAEDPSTRPVDRHRVEVKWRGLTLSTDADSSYLLREVEGWESLPATRVGGEDRPTGHGQYPGRVLAGARQVIASGECLSEWDRTELLDGLQREASLGMDGAGFDDLTVDSGGRTLTARAQVVGCNVTVGEDFDQGVFPWVVEWVCADPFRYDTTLFASTRLPVSSGGLVFPLFDDGFLDFGSGGSVGRAAVSNPGTAEARPVFTVAGPLPDGFELTEMVTGRRLRYVGPVAAGQAVTLDSATGHVRLGGADRGGLLVRAEWWGVPPGEGRQVKFDSLGSWSADASLTVAVKPTYW